MAVYTSDKALFKKIAKKLGLIEINEGKAKVFHKLLIHIMEKEKIKND